MNTGVFLEGVGPQKLLIFEKRTGVFDVHDETHVTRTVIGRAQARSALVVLCAVLAGLHKMLNVCVDARRPHVTPTQLLAPRQAAVQLMQLIEHYMTQQSKNENAHSPQ